MRFRKNDSGFDLGRPWHPKQPKKGAMRRVGTGAEQRAGWVLTVLASMQLVHGGEVGDDIELDSEGVHLQRELARCLCQLRVGLLAERVRGAPKPDV